LWPYPFYFVVRGSVDYMGEWIFQELNSMKFWTLPKEQRNNTFNRIKQLQTNLKEYKYQVANLKNSLEGAQYEVDKTEKELKKMLDSFEDSDTILA